ncbi:matrixin family metalloprotease [Candidatus Falkowbacteria bacterium]|nr:matrixin family metalloprotease [Candidatus Falkowbacteria bacterium]
MKKAYKIITMVFSAALIIGLVFYFEKDIDSSINNLSRLIQPCDKPIKYSLGEFDKRFGLSQEDFLKAVDQAAQIWQEPLNKKLFSYAAGEALKINLIYDSRQEATDKLKKLGFSIHNDQATYDSLKAEYNAFDKIYKARKNELDNIVKYYEEQKANYDEEVKAANKRGGANSNEYAILEQERKDLNNLAESIKQKQTAINKTVEDINAVASVINRLIRELNLSVSDYNTVGAGASGEFQEGQYVRDASGERINIYQFDNHEALIRVLAHELGHALGLEHIDNPQAIMYRLNESGNDKITADDIAALKQVCKIK